MGPGPSLPENTPAITLEDGRVTSNIFSYKTFLPETFMGKIVIARHMDIIPDVSGLEYVSRQISEIKTK